MPFNVLMPALSPTMEKGNLAKWLKKEGDKVNSGDILAEIETDKATMEVEAVDEGVLAKIIIPGGTQDVAVNTLIGVIAADGEDVGALSSPSSAAPSVTKTAAAPAVSSAEVTPVSSTQSAVMPQGHSGTKVFASPLAKRLAKDGGLDLSLVKGTGPHGRIVERDVKAALAGGPLSKPAASSTAPTTLPPLTVGMADATIKQLFEPGSYEEVPHDSMRKTIARRLLEAKQTIPHFYLSSDVELDALLVAREEINSSAPKGADGKPVYKLSVNDFVIKALAVALMRVPEANVTWTDRAMLKHKHADIGVAVSIPGGLITPVIRKAETKSLSQISNEMKDLAARARARKLKPDEYQGGTTAVSNLGMFGVKSFSAIVNPPHATILAVGAGEQRPVVKNGALQIAHVMTVTFSTDHRAVDGALGAELLAAFKALIENPVGMLV